MKLKVILSTIIISLIFLFYPLTIFANEETGEEFDVSAPSAILIDSKSGKILFEKNPSEVRYTASLMKMMNLLIAFDTIKDFNSKVTISKEIPRTSGSNIWLKQGETVKTEDLIKAIALVSADDACIALADHISGDEGKFLQEMNNYASKYDLKSTIFKNCIAEDIDGNVSTAHDIAFMAKALLECEKAADYTSKWIDHIRGGKTQIVNTNKLIKLYPGTTGIKTGTSKEAGSCACICSEKNKMSLIAVVLGCKDVKERNSEVTKLLDYGFSEYSLSSPPSFEVPKYLKVENGIESCAELSVIKSENFLVANKNKEKISPELVLDEKLEAPVIRGKKVGEIIYRQGNDIVCVSDVVTHSSVDKKDFSKLLKKLAVSFLKL